MVICMKSLKKEVKIELVINKSTFINYLIPINNLEDVHKSLSKLKELHRDASHHCFAYIIGNNQEVQNLNNQAHQ